MAADPRPPVRTIAAQVPRPRLPAIAHAALMARRLALRRKRRHGRSAIVGALVLAHRWLHRQGRALRPISTSFYRLKLHPSLRVTLAAASARSTDRPTGTAALGRYGSPRELHVVERSRHFVREIVRHGLRSEGGAPRSAPLRHVAPPAWPQSPPMVILRQPAERPRDATDAGPGTWGRTIAAPVIRSAGIGPAEPAGASTPLGRAQLERLTEEVIKGIDRRFVALRERMGRG